MSTGLFPQEFIIRFAEPTKLSVVTVDSYNGMDAVIVSHMLLLINTSENQEKSCCLVP